MPASSTSARPGSRSTDPGPATALEQEPERRKPGRPRDARADDAILHAVVELLVEEGFGGLTIDAVAHRAGVGKATIYRRWPGKEQLVLDALAATKEQMEMPDTGSLREDLLQVHGAMREPINQQTVVRLLPALAAEAAVNPELAVRLQAFIADRREPSLAALERGRARGEVRADVDLDHCIDLLTGPLLYRLFFRGGEVTHELIASNIDLVLRAIAPDPA